MTEISKAIGESLQLIEELQARIATIYGFYFDCRRAMLESVKSFEEMQRQMLSTGVIGSGPASVEEADLIPFTYGSGHPDDPKAVKLHEVTQGELKARNKENGTNQRVMCYAVISLLYSLWNDELRPRIAKSFSIKMTDLKSDVFGDIRLIRNSIIHHDGIALPEINKCKVIRIFKSGDLIIFNNEQMEDMLYLALADLDVIALSHLGLSTEYGIKRNVYGRAVT